MGYFSLPNGVATEHPEYSKYAEEYRTISDCIEGQAAVKRGGIRYLPKPEGWTQKRYNAYKKRAHFLNATARTQGGMIGIAFNKPATYEFDAAIEYLSTDVDGEGTDIDQFVRTGATQNTTYGRGLILTDYDGPTDPNAPQTMANTGRVMFRMFDHRQIINWRKSNGKYTLIVLAYMDDLEHGGFEHYRVKRYLELRIVDGLAYSRIWTDDVYSGSGIPLTTNTAPVGEETEQKDPELQPIIAQGKHLDYLPISWFGSESNDEKVDPPPLADVSNTNIAHFQADADVSDSSFICGQPTLVLSGVSPSFAKDNPNGVIIGASEALILSSFGATGSAAPTAEILVADPNTQAAALLEKREKQLAMLGAKLVERNGATKTATQAGTDEKTDNSILSKCIGNFEAAMNQALEYAKDFTGATGNVHINKRYEDIVINPSEITSYMSAVQSGMMRMIDFLAWQQRSGLIPNDADLEEIEQELKDGADDMQMLFNVAARQAQSAIDNPDGEGEDDDEKDPEKDKPISKKKPSAPRGKKAAK